jgi:hypothetical protein
MHTQAPKEAGGSSSRGLADPLQLTASSAKPAACPPLTPHDGWFAHWCSLLTHILSCLLGVWIGRQSTAQTPCPVADPLKSETSSPAASSKPHAKTGTEASVQGSATNAPLAMQASSSCISTPSAGDSAAAGSTADGGVYPCTRQADNSPAGPEGSQEVTGGTPAPPTAGPAAAQEHPSGAEAPPGPTPAAAAPAPAPSVTHFVLHPWEHAAGTAHHEQQPAARPGAPWGALDSSSTLDLQGHLGQHVQHHGALQVTPVLKLPV